MRAEEGGGEGGKEVGGKVGAREKAEGGRKKR